MTTPRIIVLVGTPGSGKTWMGETLARRLNLCFLDMERILLAEYGTTERFVANKPAALDWFEARVREEAAREERTLIFEIGAFSQRSTVQRLQEDFATVLVLVSASAMTRRQRLEDRALGRHFVDEVSETMRHDAFFEREVKPTFDFAFEIVNENLSESELVHVVRRQLSQNGLRLREAPA